MDRYEVILADTRHAGNIGATARAMKNFGFSRMTLVNPTSRAHIEAVKMAVGAEDVIENATITDTLKDALAPLDSAFAITRRPRRLRREAMTPPEGAGRLAGLEGRAGLVFGSEKFGLSNEQVRMCGAIVTIPTTPQAPSLNLSHAVTVILYEIVRHEIVRRESGEAEGPRGRYASSPASLEERGKFYERLTETLVSAGFFNTPNADRTVSQVENIFNRANLDRKDIKILLGAFKKIKRSITGRS